MLGVKNPAVDSLRTNGQRQVRCMYGIRHHTYGIKHNFCWGQLQGYRISILVINKHKLNEEKEEAIPLCQGNVRNFKGALLLC